MQQISRCRLTGATDPNPRDRVKLRTGRSPGPVPSFDASAGDPVARQVLAIDISGEDSVAGRLCRASCTPTEAAEPTPPDTRGHTHGDEQVKRRTAWFHGSIMSTLASSRTVCGWAGVHRAGLPSTTDPRRRRRKRILRVRSLRTPACVHPAPTGLRADVGTHRPAVLPERVLYRWMARRLLWRP